MTPEEIAEFNELMTRNFSGDFHATFRNAGLTDTQILAIGDILRDRAIARLAGQRVALDTAISSETAKRAERIDLAERG